MLTKEDFKLQFTDWQNYCQYEAIRFDVAGDLSTILVGDRYSHNEITFTITDIHDDQLFAIITDGQNKIKAEGILSRETGRGLPTIPFSDWAKVYLRDESKLDFAMDLARSQIEGSVKIDWDDDYPSHIESKLYHLIVYYLYTNSNYTTKLKKGMAVYDNYLMVKEELQSLRKGETSIHEPYETEPEVNQYHFQSRPPFFNF